MCGILGYFNFSKNLPSRKEFTKSLNLMRHRGPDGSGVSSFENGFLGHRRLSIIDLTNNAKQPMFNEDESIAITFNGEIFNYKELKSFLEKKHAFKSNSDTEVLIHGYEEWGLDLLLKKINGQFAFGLYDLKKKKIFLVRDRSGINPLYYSLENNTLIFSSELKSINYFLKQTQLDSKAVDLFFRFGYIPSPMTIFTNIKKLKPAHYIEISKNYFFEREYWKLNISNNGFSIKKNISKIQALLDESVKKRLVSDVPIGAFLSGGADSSAVVATMAKYKSDLHTFSIGFENSKYDETKYAQNIADAVNTDHHVKILTEKDFFKYLEKVPFHYDEPFADSSQIPTMAVSDFAKKYVTVSLSGDGGDELFAGYNSHVLLNKYALLSKSIYYTKYLWSLIGHSKIAENLFPNKLNNLYNSFYYFYGFHNLKFDNNMLNYIQKVDYKYYLPDDILTKVDRASLAFSLESRPPLLDNDLVDFAFSILPEQRIKNNISKFIFKKALEDRVPKYNLYRDKMGFGF
ncbi:MAG: asparagine synthase (glutamine-hydrolyzing), partial [archaeon]